MNIGRIHAPRFPELAGKWLNEVVGGNAAQLSRIESLYTAAFSANGACLVQIGAYDGEFDDPARDYLVRYSSTVSALLIEPQKKAYHRLCSLYDDAPNVRTEYLAVGSKFGEVVLSHFATSAADQHFWRAGATVHRQQLHAMRRWHRIKALLTHSQPMEEVVMAMPLAAILDLADVQPKDISIFISDTEGCDIPIARQLLNCQAEPRLIQFEHLFATSGQMHDILGTLAMRGYKFEQTYKDTIAYQN